ncbi:MAG: hypothetical protein R2911_22315 [Caldilineaceae bacterium]
MSTQPFTYQIRVQGHLGDTLREWFEPLQVSNEAAGEATLSGPMRDQAELYGVLLKLYNLNFTLIAVARLKEPSP